jgi:hypothetical protein
LAVGESVGSTAVVSGLNYLDNAQNNDGGFPYAPGVYTNTLGAILPLPSDTNSTAYVIQSLLAAGQPLTDTRWTTTDGSNPLNYLLDRQLANGGLEYGTSSDGNQNQKPGIANLLVTQQAIPALLGQPFPLRQAALETCPNTFLPVILSN